MQTIDKVLSARNLTEACKDVIKNKGSWGVDKMSVKELKPYLDKNREELTGKIRHGRYLPQPIRGKEIPKRTGKKRLLGIRIRRPVNFTILGYGFVPAYKKGTKGQYQLNVEQSRWKQLKAKLKEATRKTTPMSFDERVQKIKEIQRGWINNFRMASIQEKLKELDGWLRNRLRYCIWSRPGGRRRGRGSGKTLSGWA